MGKGRKGKEGEGRVGATPRPSAIPKAKPPLSVTPIRARERKERVIGRLGMVSPTAERLTGLLVKCDYRVMMRRVTDARMYLGVCTVAVPVRDTST